MVHETPYSATVRGIGWTDLIGTSLNANSTGGFGETTETTSTSRINSLPATVGFTRVINKCLETSPFCLALFIGLAAIVLCAGINDSDMYICKNLAHSALP